MLVGEMWSWSYLQATGECLGDFLGRVTGNSFGILLGLGPALLAGTLPLKYCAVRFAGKGPLLGVCQYLDMLLAWSLQRVVWREVVGGRGWW